MISPFEEYLSNGILFDQFSGNSIKQLFQKNGGIS